MGPEEPELEICMTALRTVVAALCLLASSAAFAQDSLAQDSLAKDSLAKDSLAKDSPAKDPLPRAKPEDVGMSSERLARIDATLNADIEAGKIPGAVIAIARHGKLVMFNAYGWRDKTAHVPMTTDTIFNVASMTKPMTTIGLLMLYEQGKVLIDDPLSKYFPKFANMRVAARDANGEPTTDTVPANRQITIQDLLRHTSGLIYGGRGATPVHRMYPVSSAEASRDYDGTAFLDKLSSATLL
jgi:pentapeptide MXKDX repeat protein